MTISILGSGNIGSVLARRFAAKSLTVSVANSRGAASLAPLAAELEPHVQAVDVDQALHADIIILALPYTRVPDLAQKIDWNGRIVIDATNAIDFPSFAPTDLGGKLSTAINGELLAGANVVKAFNTLPAAVLGKDPVEAAGRRVIFLSGDSADARKSVASLIDSLGYAPVDLGTLEAGRVQQFGEPLMVKSLLLEA